MATAGYFWVEGVGWHFIDENGAEAIVTDTATHAALETGVHGLDSLRVLIYMGV